MTHAQPHGAPPKKGTSKACMVIFGIIAGGMLIIGCIIGYIWYTVASDPELRNVAEAVGEGVDIMMEAQQAPGTAELRDLGCSQAMVLDVEKMRKLINRFDAGMPPPTAGEARTYVMCQVGRFGSNAPKCQRAATVYARAARPGEKFVVMVQIDGDEKNSCAEVYDPGGRHLRPLMGTADAGP